MESKQEKIYTLARISKRNIERIKELGNMSETIDDVVGRLIDNAK